MLKTLLQFLVAISTVISAPMPKDTYVLGKLPDKTYYEAGYGGGDVNGTDYGLWGSNHVLCCCPPCPCK